MNYGDYSSDSDNSIHFEGGEGTLSPQDDLGDENIVLKSRYNVLNNLRIMVIKALIVILVDGLPLDEQTRTKFGKEILEALKLSNIVPSQYDLPIVSDVTNQVRQYLEKLIITALNKSAKTNNGNESEELRVEVLQGTNKKINLKYHDGTICLPSRYRDDFDELNKLGKGGFGSVFKVVKKSDGSYYAIKKVVLSGTNSNIELCIREVQQMVRLSHPNIVRYFNSWTEIDPSFEEEKDCDWSGYTDSSRSELSNTCSIWKDPFTVSNILLYIQMELCVEDLTTWLERRNKSKASVDHDNKNVVMQILKGVQYLHDMDILHRDLKPQNILINSGSNPSKFIIKITDFGLSRHLKNPCIIDNVEENETGLESFEALSVGIGTPPYISPEQVESPCYDFKSDIYCIGLMAYEIFWPMDTQQEKFKHFENLKHSIISEAFAQQKQVLSDFVVCLTKKDPSDRPSASEALSHQCFEVLLGFDYLVGLTL